MKYLMTTLQLSSRTSNIFVKRFKSSHDWLQRQMSDPYVARAKIMNYRCRSSFKLVEINEKHKIFQPGHIVIDIGAAPGSFSQVCVKAVNSDGRNLTKPQGIVIGIDKLHIYPLPGATFLGGADFTSKDTQQKLKVLLDGKKANVVMSDMAPNASGIKSLDYENIVDLAKSVFHFAKDVTEKNGTLLIKIWENPDVRKLQNEILEFYEQCRIIKPLASRSDSAEKFIFAKGFKG